MVGRIAAGVEPRHGEQGVDDSQLVARIVANLRHVLGVFGIAEGTSRLVLHEIGEPEDAGQGCAQPMAQIGEKRGYHTLAPGQFR